MRKSKKMVSGLLVAAMLMTLLDLAGISSFSVFGAGTAAGLTLATPDGYTYYKASAAVCTTAPLLASPAPTAGAFTTATSNVISSTDLFFPAPAPVPSRITAGTSANSAVVMTINVASAGTYRIEVGNLSTLGIANMCVIVNEGTANETTLYSSAADVTANGNVKWNFIGNSYLTAGDNAIKFGVIYTNGYVRLDYLRIISGSTPPSYVPAQQSPTAGTDGVLYYKSSNNGSGSFNYAWGMFSKGTLSTSAITSISGVTLCTYRDYVVADMLSKKVAYRVNVPTAGYYNIKFISPSAHNNANGLQLSVNGGTAAALSYSTPTMSVGIGGASESAQTVNMLSLNQASLNAGTNYLVIQPSAGTPLAANSYIRTDTIGLEPTVTAGAEYVFDNSDSTYSESGNWSASSLLGYNNSNTRYTKDATAYATWSLTNIPSGYFLLYVYSLSTTSNSNTKYDIVHNGVTSTVYFNQTQGNGFSLLGEGLYDFSGSGLDYIRVYGDSLSNTRVDSVKLVFVPSDNVTEIAAYKIDFSGININDVTSNIFLPTTGYNNTTISWYSSDQSAISNTGILGTVTQDKTVILTATVSKEGFPDYVRDFTFKVHYRLPLALDTTKIINEYVNTTVTDGIIEMTSQADSNAYFFSSRLTPQNGKWDLSGAETLVVTMKNTGSNTVNVSAWAVSDGWGGIGGYGGDGTKGTDYISIAAGETKSQQIYLNEFWPDKRQKFIDPANITKLHIVMKNGTTAGSKIQIMSVMAVGTHVSDGYTAAERLVVPTMSEGTPAPGIRVKNKLPGDEAKNLYHVLYLPTDWAPDHKYPVIVEFPGNIYYVANVYSTGYPEDCMMGYGDSQGIGYIWVSMPIVSADGNSIAPNGWGTPNLTFPATTKEYTLNVVRYICENYGGDPAGVFISGFSRGAISTGYIGLANDEIADTWIGFHATQHTDGSAWNGADVGYQERGARVKGRATMIVDNSTLPWATLMPQLGNPLLSLTSGVGTHTSINSLDSRPSTVAERQWYADTYQNKPGTYKVTGKVTDSFGNPVSNALIETGRTHFTYTDSSGNYSLEGLILCSRSIKATKNNITIGNYTLNPTSITDQTLNFQATTDVVINTNADNAKLFYFR